MLSEAANTVDTLAIPVGTFSGGALLAWLFMKATLSQMKSWKEIIIAHEKTNSTLVIENGNLKKLLSDTVTMLSDVRIELGICKSERASKDRRIGYLENDIKELKVQVIELRDRGRAQR